MTKAFNDQLIEYIINSENFIIKENGKIFTNRIKGGAIGEWHECLYRKKKNGYNYIAFKYKELAVHRIIYRKFIGHLNIDEVINHKDGNKLNNSPSNLELISHGKNLEHGYKILNNPAVYGNKKISFEIADEIRQKRKEGFKLKELSNTYNLSISSISEIVNNKIWIK